MTHSYDHATATGRKLQVINESLARSRTINARYPDTLSIDKDSIKSGIQEILSPSNTTVSLIDIQAEEARLAKFDSQFARDFSKGGKTWSMMLSDQTNAQRARQTLQITARKSGVQGIINNPKNIERWLAIQIKEQEEEEERLLQIELEKKRIQDEIKRKETARLLELENQKRNKIILENDILFQLSREKKSVIPVVIPIIKPATIPAIDPAVLPSIVATSSLIPLGILAILLINSSRSKK